MFPSEITCCHQMDMKRHSLKVVNAISWAVSKSDKFDEIKPDLISLGERHRNYGLKLCYIRVRKLCYIRVRKLCYIRVRKLCYIRVRKLCYIRVRT